MPHYQPRDVVLISFPFTDLKKKKKRPALVLLRVGDGDVLVARITSKSMNTSFDVIVSQWRHAGLLLPSIVRLHKLGTIDEGVIEKKLGTIATIDWKEILSRIEKLFEQIKET